MKDMEDSLHALDNLLVHRRDERDSEDLQVDGAD